MNATKLRIVILVFFIICALLVLTLGGCEGENNQNLVSGTESILNSSFETGIDKPQSWFPFCESLKAGFNYTWNEKQAKTGIKSIQLTTTKPNYTGWVQIVLLKANTNYRLSGWIKTEKIRSSTAFNPKMTHNLGANLAVLDHTPRASKETAKWRIHSSGLLGTNPWTYVN
jgi:hypothetical protein